MTRGPYFRTVNLLPKNLVIVEFVVHGKRALKLPSSVRKNQDPQPVTCGEGVKLETNEMKMGTMG